MHTKLAAEIERRHEAEFQLYCWSIKNDVTKSCSEWQAIEMFKSELPAMCIEKISSCEDTENFSRILSKLRISNCSTLPPLDFERAHAYPIHKLAEELTGSQVRLNLIKCPAHSDKTPSLYLRRRTNRFHCYSCNRKGDPIDLMMLWTGCTNIDAVKRLT